LRVHTTNNNTGDSVIAACIGVVIKLSQIIYIVYNIELTFAACLAANTKNQSHVATASIKKPIHNVKEARLCEPYHQPKSVNRYSSSLEIV
jgi:hypothetical protein